MSSSFFSSRSVAHRRPVQSGNGPILSTGTIRPSVDQSPNPRPIYQFLALGFILFLGLLQFMPATHFRNPSDPLRRWIPFDSNLPSSSINSRASSDENAGHITTPGGEHGMMHIVSWMNCLDLRMLAVLANSTLSSSRYPERVSFHFFIPDGNDDKVSYYKLKVLFPHSNLEIIGQEKVMEEIMKTYSAGRYVIPPFEEIAPFVIPILHPLLSKFIYVSPNVIVKGRVEELLGVNLNNYGMATAEDCSKRISGYVHPDVLDAIQRSAAKPWVSMKPYAKDTCMPDLSLVLIDAIRLEKDIMEAILWWSKVLNRSKRNSPNPAILLALYNRYLKLPSSWVINNLTSSEINNGSLIMRYKIGGSVCSNSNSGTTVKSDLGEIWKQYLPPLSDQILG